MNIAVKISLLSSGLFLLSGMLIGIVKYRRMMISAEHTSPVYIDIAHRVAFFYSFAMIVIARLLEYSPYSDTIQLFAIVLILIFFVSTVGGHLFNGLKNETDNIFRERSFSTTWYMYLLIPAHVGGLLIILWGFVATQFLGRN